jgi:hypothetical protein
MNHRNWTPGRKAIAQMFTYAERFLGWGALGDKRGMRQGLATKTKALIYQDRAA